MKIGGSLLRGRCEVLSPLLLAHIVGLNGCEIWCGNLTMGRGNVSQESITLTTHRKVGPYFWGPLCTRGERPHISLSNLLEHYLVEIMIKKFVATASESVSRNLPHLRTLRNVKLKTLTYVSYYTL